jgi:hypothetical protein
MFSPSLSLSLPPPLLLLLYAFLLMQEFQLASAAAERKAVAQVWTHIEDLMAGSGCEAFVR